MALRFTRNDALAYNAFSDLGQNIASGYRQGQLRDAYNSMTPETVTDDDYNVGPTTRYRLGDQYSDTPYTQDQIDQARMKAMADVYSRTGMPEQGLKLRQMAQQGELNNVKLQSAKAGLEQNQRTNRYGQKEEAFFNFMQNNASLPDDEFYRNGAKFATEHIQDGKSFGITFDPNEGYKGVVTNPDGTSSIVPIKSREGFTRTLQKYVSPRMMQEADKQDLEERKLGVQERNAATMEGYRKDQAEANRAHADLYRSMAGYYDRDRPRSGGTSGYERMPEADRIMLTSLERQEQGLSQLMGKTEDPSQRGEVSRELMSVRGRQYDMQKKYKLIPEGTARWQYMGLPNPLLTARTNMAQFGNDEGRFRQSLEAFDEMYGDDPTAAQARNAMATFLNQQFYSRVRPQNQGLTQPFSNMPPEQAQRVREMYPHGLTKFN